MRDDKTEPRDNQQIADDNQQSEVDVTQRQAEEMSGRTAEDEPDNSSHVPSRGDRASDEPED